MFPFGSCWEDLPYNECGASAQCLTCGGSPVMNVATVVLVKHQDDVHLSSCQATAGRPKRGHFLGPLTVQQDVRSQMTWPGCVIWGKSLAFPESLFPHLQSGDDHSTLPTCCMRRCGQKPKCEMPRAA